MTRQRWKVKNCSIGQSTKGRRRGEERLRPLDAETVGFGERCLHWNDASSFDVNEIVRQSAWQTVD